MIDMSTCTRGGVLLLCYCVIILNSVLHLYSWCMNGLNLKRENENYFSTYAY